MARALHEASKTPGPFVPINCGSIVATLLESELFGHEKGAFTGATARKIGKLELAGEGTIFFDEVGDLPVDLQAKLLRALQEEEFERVGGIDPIPIRARVMAATHRDLDAMVRAGTFRQDLYFRLAVAPLFVPPLRDRPEDIPLLAEFLIRRIARRLDRPVPRLGPEVIARLREHAWPGNVRELDNVLTRALAMLRGDVIHGDELRFLSGVGEEVGPLGEIPDASRPTLPEIGRLAVKGALAGGRASTAGSGAADRQGVLPLREIEAKYVAEALERLDWNITHTAEALEISPTTLRKKIQDYGLRREP